MKKNCNMKHRISIALLLALMPGLPALAQISEIDVLSHIISSSASSSSVGGNAQSADNLTQGLGIVLDFVGSLSGNTDSPASPASALDYITASDKSDPYEALAGLFSKQQSGSGLSALDVITGAYNGMGFFESGVLDNIGSSNNFIAPSTISPVTGTTFFNPGWGLITSGFGYRPSFKRMHKGIDISMAVGDTVRVIMPGVVERVAYEAKGYGNYIIVRHDEGYETRYAHLIAPLVAAGQRVEAGVAIGLSGNTGNSTGPHLHFEVRYNGTALDPLSVFSFSGNQQNANYSTPVAEGQVSTMATGFNGSKKSLTGKSTYVVREGDTPHKIAARAGISVFRLCQLNFIMENQKLEPGTMVKLK